MVEIKVEEKTNVTKVEPPVQKQHTEPWKPAKLLEVKPIPGWRLHWVRMDDLERATAEGWEPVKGKDLTQRTTIDGTQMDSNVTKRELILCKMPEGRAKQMDAYFAKKSAEALSESVKTFEESGDPGLSYGSIKISHEE